LAHTSVAIRFAQLLIGTFHDQRVVEKRWWRGASEQSGDPDLTAGRWQKIGPTNHVVDVLTPVVDCDCELIRPVAVAIAHQHVAALVRRILRLTTEPGIFELLDSRIDSHYHSL